MAAYLAKYRGMGTVLLDVRDADVASFTNASAEERARPVLRVGVSMRLQAALDPHRDDVHVVAAEVTTAVPWWLHSGPTGPRPHSGRVLVSGWSLEVLVACSCPVSVLAARLGHPNVTFARSHDAPLDVPPPRMALVSLVEHPLPNQLPSASP